MEKIGVAFFNALAKIGVAYIVAAVLVGADTLVPHKYVVMNTKGD